LLLFFKKEVLSFLFSFEKRTNKLLDVWLRLYS